jgi:hypothetical protein
MKTHAFRVLHVPLLIVSTTFCLVAPVSAQLTNFQGVHSFGNAERVAIRLDA